MARDLLFEHRAIDEHPPGAELDITLLADIDGAGRFEPCIIQEGVPTHEAKVADLTGNGLPDIVGKPYSPENHVDI